METNKKQLHSSGLEIIGLLEETLKKMYGSLDVYARESRIPESELKALLSGHDPSLMLFFRLIFDANASLALTNCFGHKIIYPEPRESDCSSSMNAEPEDEKDRRKRA